MKKFFLILFFLFFFNNLVYSEQNLTSFDSVFSELPKQYQEKWNQLSSNDQNIKQKAIKFFYNLIDSDPANGTIVAITALCSIKDKTVIIELLKRMDKINQCVEKTIVNGENMSQEELMNEAGKCDVMRSLSIQAGFNSCSGVVDLKPLINQLHNDPDVSVRALASRTLNSASN